MRISIFWNLGGNFSTDRYARELGQNFPPEVEVNHVRYPVASGWKGRIWDRHLKYLWKARREQGDYNIVVSEGCAFLLSALDRERTIVVCHDVHPLIYRGPRLPGFWRMRYKFNLRRLRRARYVVTVSEHTRKDLLEYCPFLTPEKVVAVHSGIETNWRVMENDAQLAGFRRQRGLESKKFVLHVGNDNWYKNFSGLLRAVAALSDKALLLVKVGEVGPDNRQLISDLGLGARVVHVPEASSDDLLSFYNAAEMLVFPSWHEGFGWPPLEAMACGCPVVASNRASVPEVCGDACLFIDPADPAAITAAIERMLTDEKLRAEMIKKGIARAQRFRWRDTTAAMLKLLQQGEAR